ncbi:hypothetical protein BBJ28_00008978 [Nothophytophthora sp. Chile5]|nr:hypothetical protein BBJ28_00008978 [Nothophytophthora sp. Chile5]
MGGGESKPAKHAQHRWRHFVDRDSKTYMGLSAMTGGLQFAKVVGAGHRAKGIAYVAKRSAEKLPKLLIYPLVLGVTGVELFVYGASYFEDNNKDGESQSVVARDASLAPAAFAVYGATLNQVYPLWRLHSPPSSNDPLAAFGVDNSEPDEFVFLVAYTAQDEEGDNGGYAIANNAVVAAIGQLTLWIQGGGGYKQINMGKVVQLKLAEDLLTAQSQVTSVSLVSMDLTERLYDLPGMVPSSITYLSLTNTLLSSFPLHLKVLSDITILYLANNSLTEIPAVVFTLRNLTKLTIFGNPLASRTFTESQISFLQSLKSLDVTDADFQVSVDCNVSNQRVIGSNSVAVCVKDLNSLQPSSSSSSSFDTASASSSLDKDTTVHSETSDTAKTSTLLVVIVVASGIVLVALLVSAMYYWRRRRGGQPRGFSTPHFMSGKPQTTSIWNDPDLLALQVNLEDITDIRVIGSGGFGVVWLVKYRNSAFLASKRIRAEMGKRERTEAFVEEIKLVSRLDHPNIVAFVGVAWSIEADLQALFEFIENGDLRLYLSAPTLHRHWTRLKFQLAIDVIEALVYVHSFTPPLVHRDLKSRNVLISAEMRAKLTDFGVSRFRSSDGTMTLGIGTSRWLAPEVISGSSTYDQSADIFSFGVLLSEFDTHALPYEDVKGKHGNKLEDVAILQMVASGSLRPTFRSSCPPTVRSLAMKCMAQEPRARPVAAKIAYILRTLQKEMYSA